MTHYFYTDPLAAAWMAKHFGMKFQLRDDFFDPDITYRLNWTDVTAWSINCFDSVRGQFSCSPLCPAERLYIHPDSLHLLEPRHGDVFQWWAWRDRETNKKDYLYTAWDFYNILGGYRHKITKIIQRDGKPFFWPESEP